jgi:phosphoribosyl 1,2-cyclic phosphodiesterase/CheY-like chemotaxis protein
MRTLVVIDDEPVIREMLVRHLEAQGWRVFEADNGDEGIALVGTHRPVAVLCDLLMPGTNGFNVCRAIRARGDELGNITIIVTTGSSFPADRQNALEAGATHYLVKPVSPKEIAAILASVQARPCDCDCDCSSENAAPRPVRSEADSARVRFWGVRGSIATPGPDTVRYGGNTTCVEVRVGEDIVVLDAGTGIRLLGEELRREFSGRQVKAHLLLTHTHWDHIQGLPFFGPIHDPGSCITVLGYEGARQSLLKTLSAQMDSAVFPVGLDQVAGGLTVRELHGLEFRAGRVPVQAIFTHHPGITLGYRLSTPGGGVVFMPDTEVLPYPRPRPGKTTPPGATANEDTQNFNTYKNQLLAEFAQGAELFICDAQYTAEEYEGRIGWGHSCIDDTVHLALQARVKHLILFHHDPTHNDDAIDRIVEHAREIVARTGGSLRVDAAAEGMEIVLHRKPRTPAPAPV